MIFCKLFCSIFFLADLIFAKNLGLNLVRGAEGFLLNVFFALLSVSVTLLVYAGGYLKC